MVTVCVGSPLPAAFDRVLQVFCLVLFLKSHYKYGWLYQEKHVLVQFGDASGIQSPVSFGGFGSLTRHLSRLTTGMV